MYCLLALSIGSAVPAANLLANGDFERGLEGWQVTAPPGGKVEVVPGPRGNCVRLTSSDRSGSTYAIPTLDPQLLRGRRVRVEAWVKAENVVVGTYPYSQAKITLVWNDGHNDNGSEVDFLDTFDWKKVSVAWHVGDNGVSATLYLGLHTTTGTVWFDDVSLTVPELKSVRTVVEGVEERVYDDGVFFRVDGREFTEAKPPQPSVPYEPTPAEKDRGFVVFQPEEPSDVVPGRIPARNEVIPPLTKGGQGGSAFDLLAAPDQYEPLVFALSALRPLEGVSVQAPALRRSEVLATSATGATIPPTAFDVRLGRHVIQRVGYTGSEYHVVPKLLEKNREVRLEPERPQLFWLTLHVPPDAPAGEYSGQIDVRADGQNLALPVRLRVLPFRLARSKPWMLYFYHSDPADAGLYFRDMREHGLTSVILAQVQAPLRREGDRAVMDFATSDAFVEAYRKAGFSDPLVYNPFHDRLATRLLEIFGLADQYPKVVNYGETICVFQEGEYPAFLQEVYRQVVRDIYDHARQADWPSLLFYPVDEPNDPNDWRMTAARLEYRLTKETVPTARTFCTVYSIPIMERLDPYLDVRTCHIVHPAGSAEANQTFQDYLRRAGGEIWGIDWPAMWDDFWRARELAGFLPARAGVTGMTAWTYYNPSPWTDEFADLRGEYKQCLLAYRDADGSLIPTITWEGLRAGITDWRYLATLEEAVAKAEGAKRQRGLEALREALAEVPWRSEAPTGWGNRRATQLRAKIAGAILDLLDGEI